MCGVFIFLSGCHYENGRWYLGESDIVSLPDFRGEVAKVHDCLVADEDFSAKEFNRIFEEEYAEVQTEEKRRYWGYLVCLALNDRASQRQIGKTVMFLTDQIEPGNSSHRNYDAMSILLKKKLDALIEMQSLKHAVKTAKEKNMMQKMEFEMELLNQKKIKKDLEDQVRKLKEIEILLEKNTKDQTNGKQ